MLKALGQRLIELHDDVAGVEEREDAEAAADADTTNDHAEGAKRDG